MPATKRKGKKGNTEVNKNTVMPAPDSHNLSSDSSESSSPSLNSPVLPTRRPLPFSLLPPSALSRLHNFLGFTSLMDIRAVNTHMKGQCEEAALQWMSQHLTRAAQQMREAETREREKAEGEGEDNEEMKEEEKSQTSAHPSSLVDGDEEREEGSDSVKLLPSLFRRSDAIWFRQQLSRWRSVVQVRARGGAGSVQRMSGERTTWR
jgi:hypothetical protein